MKRDGTTGFLGARATTNHDISAATATTASGDGNAATSTSRSRRGAGTNGNMATSANTASADSKADRTTVATCSRTCRQGQATAAPT